MSACLSVGRMPSAGYRVSSSSHQAFPLAYLIPYARLCDLPETRTNISNSYVTELKQELILKGSAQVIG